MTYILFSIFWFSSISFAQSEFGKFFEECNVVGSTTIYDYRNQKWFFTDSVDAQKETLPASTFKVINTLISLETGALKDENEIIQFTEMPDTVLFGYRPETYHDMALEEAFRKSVLWFYYELADRVGRETYKKYLSRLDYGNMKLGQPGIDFWNLGKFGVSPIGQIKFLISIYEKSSTFSERSYEILEKIMLHEETVNYKIYAKTGWKRSDKENLGWWMGYVTTENNVYFFATRLIKPARLPAEDFSSCRKKITMQVFNSLGLL